MACSPWVGIDGMAGAEGGRRRGPGGGARTGSEKGRSRGASGRLGGEDDAEFGEESLRVFSGLLGSTVQIMAVLWRFHGGSGRSGIAGGEELLGGRLTGGGSGRKIRRVQAVGRGQQARGESCARGGAPDVVGRVRETVAWPVRGGAEVRRLGGARCAAARVRAWSCGARMGERGSQGQLNLLINTKI